MTTTDKPRERPILFSAPMVRALLDGTKTQTRRAVKGRALDWLTPSESGGSAFSPDYVADEGNVLSPYGFAGDRLWVRETLRRGDDGRWCYGADGASVELPADSPDIGAMIGWAHHKEGATCVPIHMPRWGSRIVLEVTGVRVERLQDITEADCAAEGSRWPVVAAKRGKVTPLRNVLSAYTFPEHPEASDYARSAYADLWESINGAGSWKANPWVWVVSFRRCT